MDGIKKIGFIGLGSMGGDQARELVKLGIPLALFDVHAPAIAAFEGKATLAGTIAEVGEDADVVGLCVRDDAQVTDCVAALFPVMKAGSVLLIHSTIKPATAIAIAERGAAQGIAVIDAPVSRTEMVKDGPFVFCMTGGEEAVADRVRPVLDAFSTNVVHVGRLGSAMALKICNNLVTWSEIMLGIEAANIAEAAGVPMDKLLAVMKRNGVMTPPMQGFVAFRADPGDAARRAFFASQAGIGDKDLALALEMAGGVGAAAPIVTQVKAILRPGLLAICEG